MDAEKRNNSLEKREIGQNEAVDQDEANSMAIEYSPEEQRLVRKLDIRILPITCLMYLFACETNFPI